MMGRELGGFWPPGLPASVPVARHCASIVLRGPAGDGIDDTLLVLTELIGNAIKHTRSGSPGGRVEVEFELDGPTTLLVKVIDQGSSKVPRPRPQTGTLTENGCGLHLVESLAKEWGVRWPEKGCVVWALMDLATAHKRAEQVSDAGRRSDRAQAETPSVLERSNLRRDEWL